MEITAILGLKETYEKELLMAQAKVTVINDILLQCSAVPEENTEEVGETYEETEANLTDENY